MQIIGLLAALIAALVAFSVQRRNSKSAVSGKFIEILASDIAALNAASRDADAYTILQDRFITQHNAFIHAVHVSGLFSKRRLKRAWKDYYGEEGEQEWWLPNEYSALMSNQLKNDNKNTKELAIHRLKSIVNVCK
jgi:hypothetical protein